MKLKVLAPAKVLMEVDAVKVVARGRNGLFCLLPHHVDFVTALVAGPLLYEEEVGRTGRLYIDEGVLVKNGAEVLVSTRRSMEETGAGIAPADEETERERRARAIVAGLEAEFTAACLKTREKD